MRVTWQYSQGALQALRRACPDTFCSLKSTIKPSLSSLVCRVGEKQLPSEAAELGLPYMSLWSTAQDFTIITCKESVMLPSKGCVRYATEQQLVNDRCPFEVHLLDVKSTLNQFKGNIRSAAQASAPRALCSKFECRHQAFDSVSGIPAAMKRQAPMSWPCFAESCCSPAMSLSFPMGYVLGVDLVSC